MKDYYSILGVGREATEQEIKTAYKKLSIKFHPDKNDGDSFFEDRFKEIQEAYETLNSPLKKANYNAALEPQSAREHLSKIDTNYPIITVFEVSKKAIQEGEPINLRWQTIHANEIEIDYLGKVEPAGTKTLRLPMMYDKEKIKITLTATNTFITQKIQKVVEIKNKSFKERQIQLLYEPKEEEPVGDPKQEPIQNNQIPEAQEDKEVKELKNLNLEKELPVQSIVEKDDVVDIEKMRALAKEERLSGVMKVIENNEADAPQNLRTSDVFMYIVLIVLLIFITIMSIFVYQMNPF